MLLTDDKTTSLVFLKTVKERPIQKNKNVEYTENGEYIVVPDDSFGVLEKVTVNVNVQPQLQDKDVVISTEDVIDVVADEGYSGLSKVQVIPSTKEYNKTINSNGQYNINEGKDLYNGGIITVDTPEPKQEIELTDTITENISKTYTPDDGYVYSKVNITVDVPIKEEQKKIVDIISNGTTTVTPDSGKVLNEVEINVNVPEKEIVLEDKDVVINTEDVIDVVAEDGYDGLSKVQVIPSTKEYNATFTSNNTYQINEGKDLYNGGTITVAVPSDRKEEIELNETIRENTTKSYTPDEGKVYKNVNITVDVPIKEEQKKTTAITQNGRTLVTPDDGKVLSEVEINVNVPEKTISDFKLERKTYNITENGTTQIEVGSGYDAISGGTITVNVPSTPTPPAADWTVDINNLFGSGTFTEVPDNFIGWDNLTDGSEMFKNCSTLTSFDKNISKLSNGSSMFNYCTALTSFDVTDLPLLENGYRMFYGCSGLTSFNVTELSELTNGQQMFDGCKSLTSFEGGELSKLNNGLQMFSSCSSLTSFNSKMAELTDGFRMFQNCIALTSFNGGMQRLKKGSSMFDNCTELKTLNSNFSKLEDSTGMFSSCFSLANVTLKGSLNCAINWISTPYLTVDSMLSIMNAMVDLNGQSSKTMTFGAINLAKLSDEQKSIATNKNWVLN